MLWILHWCSHFVKTSLVTGTVFSGQLGGLLDPLRKWVNIIVLSTIFKCQKCILGVKIMIGKLEL